jgi:hypothetical protein
VSRYSVRMTEKPNVRLQDIVDAFDAAADGVDQFLDPDSGEILVITEDIRAAMDEDDPEDPTNWIYETVAQTTALLDSGRAVELPARGAAEDLRVMKEFAESHPDAKIRERLLQALGQPRPARRFNNEARKMGVIDLWDAHRHKVLEAEARAWLEREEISFRED